MPTFNVSNTDNVIRPTAAAELRLLCSIAKEDGSREQALALLGLEHQRWLQSPDGYQPTWLSQTILTALHKQIGRRHTAGLVAIAMTALDNAGFPMSLSRASEIVSDFNNAVGDAHFVFWRNAEWQARKKALLSDQTDIKKVFREYKDVAHICAADVACADYITPAAPFEPRPEADACFVSTIVYYQNRLRNAPIFQNGRIIEVWASKELDIASYPPLEVSKEALSALLGPWLRRQG